MQLRLDREAPVSLPDQLAAQIKLKILEGELVAGTRLLSVRALARRLDVHPNTVLACYRKLETDGNLESRRGAGVVVRGGHPPRVELALTLEQTLATALDTAFRMGYSSEEIRAGIAAWLAAPPPGRVLVVDLYLATAEILAHELAIALPIPVHASSLDEVKAAPARAAGGLVVALPFYSDALSRLVPESALRIIRTPTPPAAILDVPRDGLALVVSHSARILPHAAALLRRLRGAEVAIECRELAQTDDWLALSRAADVVFADVLATRTLRERRLSRVVEFHLAGPEVLQELRQALAFVAPHVSDRP